MNDKQQLAAMGEHMAEHVAQAQPLCMAKRIEELEEQVRAASDGWSATLINCDQLASLLREAKDDLDADWNLSDSLRDRIDAALSGKLPEPAAPDALVAISDIASLQRYTLVGFCDSFGQDCGAEMERDDEGEYVLLADAFMLAAATNPDSKP